MQKKRLFVAIPISSSATRSVKRISVELEEKFKDFSGHKIRFVLQENWHLTVTFLGEQDDNTLPAIADAVKIASQNFEPPEIVFEKINYGPPSPKHHAGASLSLSGKLHPPKFFSEKFGRARMIWLCADRASSERVAKIKEVLDTALESRGVPFQREMKLFSGHITLARFAGETELASLPQVERPLQFSFSATSLALMESELKRPSSAKASTDKPGAEYGLLQSFKFKE